MATTQRWLIGQRISVPRFHLIFSPKSELSITKRSNFGVSVGSSYSLSAWNPKRSSPTCLRNWDDADTSSCEDKWDWNRWSRHFSEIEEIELVVSLLKSQLEEAIKKEDFQEATKLKTAIAEASLNDPITVILSQLQTSISEERYHDASRLCNDTGSGLVGWWVSYHQYSEIIQITPGVGRFIGKSYSPRRLVAGAAGTPLFEIFVVKNANGGYVLQVVYLDIVKQNPSTSQDSFLRTSNALINNPSTLDVRGGEVKVDKKEDKLLNGEEPTEEGFKNVSNFLKDKIPGLKLKAMDATIPKEETVGSDDATGELVGESIEETNHAEEDVDSIEEIADSGKHLKNKFSIGGALQNPEDPSTEDEFLRVSADITDTERDSFTLHVPRSSKNDIDTRKNTESKEQITALPGQGISEMMPPEVAKAFWGLEKDSLKVSRNVHEIPKLTNNKAKRGNRLSEYTTFNRIITPDGNLDPFDGLYVGAFGPYGTEIVQLKRKYGRWNDAEGSDSLDMESFEYVEAVKLTGDANVPAGQVTFRAKIGKWAHRRNYGVYPEELGVLASYMGEGRIADSGFKNPKWVQGQLLKLNGKAMEPYLEGADLGFLYIGPKQSFLVLFHRLRLPE